MAKYKPTGKKLPIVDLSETLAPYPNRWVALSSDETKIVATGLTPLEVITQAKEMGITDPVLTHVPKNHTPHVI